MNDALKRTFEEHKEEYLQHLKNLISCDTQVLGHGIAGGREKAGQEYLEKLFEDMGVDKLIKDPMQETIIQKCMEIYG